MQLALRLWRRTTMAAAALPMPASEMTTRTFASMEALEQTIVRSPRPVPLSSYTHGHLLRRYFMSGGHGRPCRKKARWPSSLLHQQSGILMLQAPR